MPQTILDLVSETLSLSPDLAIGPSISSIIADSKTIYNTFSEAEFSSDSGADPVPGPSGNSAKKSKTASRKKSPKITKEKSVSEEEPSSDSERREGRIDKKLQKLASEESSSLPVKKRRRRKISSDSSEGESIVVKKPVLPHAPTSRRMHLSYIDRIREFSKNKKHDK